MSYIAIQEHCVKQNFLKKFKSKERNVDKIIKKYLFNHLFNIKID